MTEHTPTPEPDEDEQLYDALFDPEAQHHPAEAPAAAEPDEDDEDDALYRALFGA